MSAIFDRLVATKRRRRTKTVCHVVSTDYLASLTSSVAELRKLTEALEGRQFLQGVRLRNLEDMLGDLIFESDVREGRTIQ